MIGVRRKTNSTNSLPSTHIIYCYLSHNMLNFLYGTAVLQGGLTSILHRMGVVLMNRKKNNDKKLFDFKDLMAFGMFILALLTFIYLICH